MRDLKEIAIANPEISASEVGTFCGSALFAIGATFVKSVAPATLPIKQRWRLFLTQAVPPQLLAKFGEIRASGCEATARFRIFPALV